MRGPLHSQVESLYHAISKGIGKSRHDLKLRGEQDRQIHSDATRLTGYLPVWHSIATFSHQHYGLNDMENLEPRMVAAWIMGRVESGIAPATIRAYRSGVAMLQKALEDYHQSKEQREGKR
jgi:hypothetical protein